MQQNPDYSQLFRLAQSPAGQKLLKRLQESGGGALRQAVSEGDVARLRQLLTALMKDPQTAQLLKELEANR